MDKQDHRSMGERIVDALSAGNKQKPRICEVLGVEVDEIFSVNGYGGEYKIDHNGQMWYWSKDYKIITCNVLCDMIAAPNRIVHHPHQYGQDTSADGQSLFDLKWEKGEDGNGR